jgi:NAD(P)-dependent dehydrogenase (short-subunit alcohol dehydrogenase family)
MARVDPFAGKNAIVTGGTSGIGLAIARALAQRGATVVVASSDPEKVKRAGASLADLGVSARQLDVRDRAAFRRLVNEVASACGRVDLLINSAGIAVLGEVRDHTDQDWDDLVDINLRGVINGVSAVYPLMIEQGSGQIVNVSSVGGFVATPFNAGYTATKFAVVGFSEALRLEAARYGVRVNVVCPAQVDTPMAVATRCRHIDREQLLRKVPSPVASAESCAQAVLRGVIKNRARITPHAASALALIHRLAPWITRLMMRRLTRTAAQLRDAYSDGEEPDAGEVPHVNR